MKKILASFFAVIAAFVIVCGAGIKSVPNCEDENELFSDN